MSVSKTFEREPAFVVDIVRRMKWLKKYFKIPFTLYQKDGKARYDAYNEEGF